VKPVIKVGGEGGRGGRGPLGDDRKESKEDKIRPFKSFKAVIRVGKAIFKVTETEHGGGDLCPGKRTKKLATEEGNKQGWEKERGQER